MGLSDRTRLRQSALESLEQRLVMTTDIIGNAGTIVFSQFNPYGNGVIGSEWWNVGVSGPVNVNLTTSPVTSGSGGTPSPTPPLPANTGLIANSQFNAGGYFKIGSQLKDIRLGGGLTVNDYDESVASASETIPTTATITTAAGVIPTISGSARSDSS
jgi:hypothetical protein